MKWLALAGMLLASSSALADYTVIYKAPPMPAPEFPDEMIGDWEYIPHEYHDPSPGPFNRGSKDSDLEIKVGGFRLWDLGCTLQYIRQLGENDYEVWAACEGGYDTHAQFQLCGDHLTMNILDLPDNPHEIQPFTCQISSLPLTLVAEVRTEYRDRHGWYTGKSLKNQYGTTSYYDYNGHFLGTERTDKRK